MKSYLAIFKNILLICFLFGFVKAENGSLENDLIKSCAVDTGSNKGVLGQDDILDEQDDNFDEIEAIALNATSLNDGSFADITLETLDEIEQAGPQGLSLSDKVAIAWGFCKDIVQQHVSRNKSKYICSAATATLILSIIAVYYLNNCNKVPVAQN